MLVPALLEPAIPSVERRSKARYELTLAVSYSTLHKKNPDCGTGHTLNMSSGGVKIAAPNGFNLGQLVRINMEWPELLNGEIPLQFIAVGRIVRCDPFSFAIAFQHHEFRTVKPPSSSKQRPSARAPAG